MARPAVACSLPAGELEHVSRGLTDAGFPVFRAATADELGALVRDRRDIGLAIIDGETDFDAALEMYEHLHGGERSVPTLMVVSPRAFDQFVVQPAGRRHDRVLHAALRRRGPALACRGHAHPRPDVRRRQRSDPAIPTSTPARSPDGLSSWPSSTPRAASARRPSRPTWRPRSRCTAASRSCSSTPTRSPATSPTRSGSSRSRPWPMPGSRTPPCLEGWRAWRRSTRAACAWRSSRPTRSRPSTSTPSAWPTTCRARSSASTSWWPTCTPTTGRSTGPSSRAATGS